jgi:deoxyribonuclease IV
VLIGAQVRQAGGFVAALRRAEAMGAEVVQLCPQNNRQWHMPERTDADYAAYRDAATSAGIVTVCHAPYLVNLVSPDRATEERSFATLVANLRAATALGARGLVLHPGSHRGVGSSSAGERIGRCCREALEAAVRADGAVCDLLLENTAGAGGTVGRTFSELATIIAGAAGDDRVGLCLDTQHLFASGVSFATVP